MILWTKRTIFIAKAWVHNEVREMIELQPCEVEEGLARWGRVNDVCRLRQGEEGREERPTRWRMERCQRGEVCKEQRRQRSEQQRSCSSESEGGGKNGRQLGREWDGERMGLRDLRLEKWVFIFRVFFFNIIYTGRVRAGYA